MNGSYLLIYAALLPLLVIASKQKPLMAFGTGILVTFVAGCILRGHMTDMAQLANLTAGMGSLAQIMGLTLCMISAARNLSPTLWIPFVASAGVTAEWIMSQLFPVSISISHHTNSFALKLASFTGIWGVTFVIWFITACIASMIFNRRYAVRPTITILSIMVILILYTEFCSPNPSHKTIRAAAIQGYSALTLSEETAKLKGKIDVAVWSENGMNIDEPDAYESARMNDIIIAANFIEVLPTGKPMNTSYLISPEGNVIGKCRKQHLFGKEKLEYTQSRMACPAVSSDNGIKIGVPTCFDTMFTDVIRNYVRDGAVLILVPNSDPEAPNHFFAKIHAGVTAFRAAENAVPVVMADTGSISTIFDSSGRVIAESDHGKPGSITAQISLRNKTTLYNRVGDILAYLCLIFVLLVLFHHWRKKDSKNISAT